MDSGQYILALIAALGLGGVIPELIRGIREHLGGRFAEERQINVDAIAQRDSAWLRAIETEKRCELREREALARVERAEGIADREAAARRQLQEYASLLRSMMVERCGIRATDLPSWPDVKDWPLNLPGRPEPGTGDRPKGPTP